MTPVAVQVVRRVAATLAVIVAVTALTAWSTALLPGDPARAILGPTASPQAVAQVRVDLHLNDPLPQRYLHWLGGAVHGDLGHSYRTGQPVMSAIGERLPVTVELMLVSQLLALLVAVPLALVAARHEGRWPDDVSSGAMLALLSVPSFVLALGLVYLFAVQLRWLPATGFTALGDGLADNLRSVALPSIALAAGSIAVYQRVLRADLTRTLREDFVTVARAKGLPPREVLVRHALRPSSLPLVTIVGLNVASLMGGAIVVEVVFALPGLGRLVADAIAARDYVMLQGVVAFIAVAYVLVNLAVDLLYGLLDPRTRHALA